MPEGCFCVDEIWSDACKTLRKSLCRETYDHWIHGIVPLSVDGDVIVLGVSDDFFAEWLDTHIGDVVNDAVAKAANKTVEIRYETGHFPEETVEPETSAPPTDRVDDPVDEDEVFAPNCLTRHTFSNFVVGEENRYAFAAAQTAAKNPGIYNPLYIYGGTGLGKTHLLQAVAHEVLQQKPNAVVEYVTCEEFLNLYVDSLQSRRHSDFRNRFRNADVLLIDDVHQLANKAQLQEEFFNTFNTLYNGNKQIFLTSDKQPCEIKGLEDRLISRFESGVTTEITIPGIETRLAILRMKQEEHLIKLSDEVLFFIASRISSSIRHLEGALFRLIAFSSAMANCPITIEVAEELLGKVLEKEAESRRVSIESIQKQVAEYFGIHVHDILGKKRPKNVAEPRMVAMYLTRRMTDLSFPEIGVAFGKNHATIINAVKKIEERCEQDEDMRRAVSFLQRQLQA